MKKKLLVLMIASLSMYSCVLDKGRPYEGFSFLIYNNAHEVFEDAEVVIGGMQNGAFIPTDSIKFDEIDARLAPRHYHFDDNRWKPNLDKIRAIPSERCYFKIKLSAQREELIMNNGSLMSLLLPSENFFKGRYGELQLNIQIDNVYGGADEEL